VHGTRARYTLHSSPKCELSSNVFLQPKSELTGKLSEDRVGTANLVGIGEGDETGDLAWLSGKIVNLRIFDDEQGIMNRSVAEVNGDLLVVSQFTLHASTRKETSILYPGCETGDGHSLYEKFLLQLEKDLGKLFRQDLWAMMKVH